MLAAMRLALIAMVLLMIAQVTLSLKRTGLPCAAVLVDDSLSMTTVDHYDDKLSKAIGERLKRAGWRAPSQPLESRPNGAHGKQRGLAARHRRRPPAAGLFSHRRPAQSRDEDVPGIVKEIRSAAPTGERTRLGAGVRTVLDELRGTTPAGLVLLSDGINTDGPPLADAAEYARRRGVPLFSIGLGSQQPLRELKLSDLLVDDVVFVNDVVTFECRLTASGFQGQESRRVAAREGQAGGAGQSGSDRRGRRSAAAVRLPFRPTQVGRFEFVVEAQPQEGELKTERNRLTRTVQVRKEKIRVLLVQAYPSFEFRYLRNMLQRDEMISLHTVLQEADLEHAEQDASALRVFPLRREELFAYDVVIFGDVNPALLSAAALQNLADFVDQPAKGGALVLIAGPAFMPAAYRPDAAGPPAAFRRGKRPLSRPGSSAHRGICRAADRHRPGQSRACNWATRPPKPRRSGEPGPVVLAAGVAQFEAGRAGLGRAPTRLGPDGRHLPVYLFSVRGGGQGAVPRHRRDVAVALTERATRISPAIGCKRSAPSAARSSPTRAAP